METTKPLQTALKTISGSLSQLKEELRNTQAEISLIGGKIAELQEMPVSLDDYGRRIKQSIDKLGDEHMKSVEWHLFRNTMGETPKNKAPFSTIMAVEHLPDGMFGTSRDTLTIGAACCYFGQQIYESFMERAKATFGDRWGNTELPTADERWKLIDELYTQREVLLQKQDSLREQIKEISDALGA